MKKSPHVIWVCPTSRPFYRSKGEVRCRPGSVIPKLADEDIKINILIPHDPTLLPKTKLTTSRVTRHKIRLSQDYTVEITKLSRGALVPGIFMVNIPSVEPAIWNALFSKSALALARQLKRPVDIFHVFDWEAGLLPLYLELEKSGDRLFKTTRTFFNLSSVRDQGSYAPNILNHLGVPKNLFHPEGLEFYGRVSYLKAGLIFADGIGLVEGRTAARSFAHRNGHGFEGILDAQSHKLRRWSSDRSVRAHLDAYKELLALTQVRSVLPRLMERVHAGDDELKKFIESWGPPPPDRYSANAISFMVQSPTKAYAFWEWIHHDFVDYGLRLENLGSGAQTLLARGLQAMADFWIDVSPASEYVLELVGYRVDGSLQPLLRSRPVRTPRNSPSPNIDAVFINVRDRSRTRRRATGKIVGLGGPSGGSSAMEWSSVNLSIAHREIVSSS